METRVTVHWHEVGNNWVHEFTFAPDLDWPKTGQPTIEMYERIAEVHDILAANIVIPLMWATTYDEGRFVSRTDTVEV